MVGTSDAAFLQKLNDAEVVSGMWKGQVPGDTLVGEIIVDKMQDSRFKKGEKQRVLVVHTDRGDSTVFCNASLSQALEGIGAKRGAKVGIQYKGDISVGKGRPMRSYVALALDGKRRRK